MKLLFACAALLVPGILLAGPGEGKAIFQKSCRPCHGPEGDGNPAVAKALKAEIPPLGSKPVQDKSDDELKQTVSQGRGKMKPVSSVTGKALDDVIAHVRTLKK